MTLMDIHDRLLSWYGDPHWWPGETPYEVMVGAVLTQNTAWHNVEKAIANFGGKLSPRYVMGLSHENLADIIRPAGFFNQKAECLRALTGWFEQYEYKGENARALPLNIIRAELLSLKRVGRETADSILLYAFGFPTFVVDAYTVRLIQRLPLPVKEDYETVKGFFEKWLTCDAALFNRYHALIVLNAKEHCKKKPVCGGCPLAKLCETEKKEGAYPGFA